MVKLTPETTQKIKKSRRVRLRTSAGYRQERLKGAILVTGSTEAEGKVGPDKKKAGDVLLSHAVAHAVPSTQKSLTTEFGMGSGVASSLLSPARLKKRYG